MAKSGSIEPIWETVAMGDRSHQFKPTSPTVQRRTWVNFRKEETPPIRDPFGLYPEASESEESDRPLPTGGFSLLESPMPMHPPVQRQGEETEAETDTDDAEDLDLQAKLTIGKPGDSYEQEADSIAAQVMKMPDSKPSPRNPELDDNDAKPQTTPVRPKLQLRGNANPSQASPQFEQTLNRRKGQGQPLAKETREFMESRFGTDFSGVRVHTDGEAAQLNKEVGAKAFTHGRDIFFNSGRYNPGSSSGKELLAHELTHTIQQTGNTLQPKSRSRDRAKSNKIQPQFLTTIPSVQRREDRESEAVSPATAAPKTETPSSREPPSPSAATSATQTAEASGKPQTAALPSQETAQPATPSGGETSKMAGETAASPTQTAQGGGGTAAPASADADPAFQAVVADSEAAATQQKQHPRADSEAQAAQDAAESPANEVESQGQDRQVTELEQQPPGTFDGEQFKAALMQRIEAVVPQTEEEAEGFKDNNQLDSVRQSVSSQVTEEQEQAAAPIEDKAADPPDTSGLEPRTAEPLEPSESQPPSHIAAEGAAPKPRSEAEVSAPLQANSASLDEQMEAAEVTETQLEQSNEPQFVSALAAKQEAQTDAQTAPGMYRQGEQGAIAQSQGQAVSLVKTGLQEMHGQQSEAMAQALGVQGDTKGKDEQKRKEVADRINEIYEKTKGDVETALDGLESEVTSRFDTAANRARQLFENHVDAKMKAYKKERYGEWYDVRGWGKRAKDAVVGLPPEVNGFFEEGRSKYLAEMDVALTDISNFVAERLNQAKTRIAQGKQEIQQYVSSLPQELKQVGTEAAQNIQSKFDELEGQVDSKRDALIDSLSQKYQEGVQAIDDRIEEMKAQNQGLVDKAKNAIGGVIQTILEIKGMLANVLGGAVETVSQILKDPIGFLGNLVTGLRQGFQNFLSNIATHLQTGLVGWLTGTMGSVGIQLPEDLFSLKGIFSLVTQVLGLSWNYVRQKAVKMFGEPVVAAMEKGSEIFQLLQSQGLTGVWEHLRDQFTDLKESVMGEIKNMVITQVIQSGITWLLGLLNPAGAFVKAAKAIYDIVMFFINRGSQVVELVQAVTQSIKSIASGALGDAAKLVENALSKALPVVIGFLASLLGLGGLANKVTKVIKRVRKRIDKAIELVLKKAKKAAKKLLKKLGLRGEEDEDAERADPEHDAKVNAGLQQIDREEAKYLKDGNKITKEEAETVAATVKQRNPVFKAISVVDAGETWDYRYAACEGTKKGEKKEEGEEEVQGAFALYRGIHFNKNLSEEDYKSQLKRDLVNTPTFSTAAKKISGSQKPDGSDVSQSDLQNAAELVTREVDKTQNPRSVKKWWGKKDQEFKSLFYAMLQDYVNRYDRFREELRKAQSGQYSGLNLVDIPFISTSKNPNHAARYALGQKGTQQENRNPQGSIIGRMFIYLFSAMELVESGAIDVQDLHKSGKIKVKYRIFKEGEVAFTGSIPGKNLVAQEDARLEHSASSLGNSAKQKAQQIATNKGGLKEWQS
ncbi:eCIS core domain-containing protein [Baaleninema sp.]|uniref:eCIS core domain-containing protein n=1 Tax=Baaleninema sp. TaxID=3101197 RepID=UPI003CFDC793